MNREFFAGKKVLVMGLGRFGGGVDVAKFACDAGAKVTITDSASAKQLKHSINQLKDCSNIEYRLGSHNLGDFEQADIIVVNPAVAPDNEFLKLARRNNKFTTTQINIFFELSDALIIGITGANGKSTTAALAAHLLRAGVGQEKFKYRKVWLSGNIGNEPLLAALDEIRTDDLVVLELSSFQAERLVQIAKGPKVALLTNLTPNHLDRYGTFTDYCAAKENIFKFQKPDRNCPAVSIFNAEDKVGAEWFEKYKNEQGRLCLKFSSDDVSEEIQDKFSLPGRANLCNLAAAIAIAKHFGVEGYRIKNCLAEFKPLPHRLELVAQIDGVSWYNDSKATTPEGAIAALEAFEQTEIIIGGGYDKGLAFEKLGKEIAKRTKAAILIGQTAKKIADAIAKKRLTAEDAENAKKKIKVEVVESLAEAVELARRLAVSGDVVLLSPGCASYDMFDNFEHRGQEFVKLVTRDSLKTLATKRQKKAEQK